MADKPICGSQQHIEQAEAKKASEQGVVDKFWDAIGLGAPADLKTVPCETQAQKLEAMRPKLTPQENDQVNKNVQQLETAVKAGNLEALGDFFNRIAPRADDKTNPDAFHKSSRVKVADETFHRLNKELGKYGIDLDYRSMGVYQGDRSPSLIVSREYPHPTEKGATMHAELTLQGGTDREMMKYSGTDKVTIRENGNTSFDKFRDSNGKTAAENAYATVMKPYLDAQKGK